MDRREFLRAGSVAVAAGVAGCTGLFGGSESTTTGTDPGSPRGTTATAGSPATVTSTATATAGADPEIEVTVETRSTPQVGESVDLVVRVENTGDRSGTFEDTLAVVEGTPTSKPIAVGPVPPGETRSVTHQITFDTPGRQRVLLVETGLETWLQVGGTPLGTRVPLGDGTEFALESARVVPATFVRGPGWGYRRDPVTDLVGTGTDPPVAVVVLRGTASVADGDATAFDPTGLAVETPSGDAAEFVRGGTTPAGIDHAELRLPDGTPSLVGARLDPGERVRGCLLCTLPHSAAKRPLTVRAGPDPDGANAVWSVGDAAPLPQFAVRGMTVPDAMETGRDRSFTVTVRNVGGAAGRFRGILQDNVHHDVYTTVGTVAGDLAPGERTRLEGTLRLPWNYERHLRLRPSDARATVEAGIARRAYGEKYRMPNGTKVAVLSPHYSGTIEFVDDRTNQSGAFWTVLVTAELPDESKGKGKGAELLPAAGDFRCKRMEVDEADFPYTQDYRVEFENAEEEAREHGNTIVKPVRGPLYPMDPPAEPSNGRVTGWMPLIIGPDDRHWPVDQLEVQLIENVHGGYDGYTAGWSEKFGDSD
jgi:hypothetical protein